VEGYHLHVAPQLTVVYNKSVSAEQMGFATHFKNKPVLPVSDTLIDCLCERFFADYNINLTPEQ
jgi:3-hydroxymyristoyl/3-hydroxydecanoyl-(acyl carrier protein) dehydratase